MKNSLRAPQIKAWVQDAWVLVKPRAEKMFWEVVDDLIAAAKAR